MYIRTEFRASVPVRTMYAVVSVLVISPKVFLMKIPNSRERCYCIPSGYEFDRLPFIIHRPGRRLA
jgi:hypothetical protein